VGEGTNQNLVGGGKYVCRNNDVGKNHGVGRQVRIEIHGAPKRRGKTEKGGKENPTTKKWMGPK